MSQVMVLLRIVLDRLTGYLPLMFMALLAAGTYALLQATPEPEAPRVERPLTSDPDFYMRNFSVRSFAEDGRLQTELFGEEGRHRPDTDSIEVDQARVRSIDENGGVTNATADLLTSNSDNNEFDLTGNAIVLRRGKDADGNSTAPIRFEGDFLRIYTEPSRLFSDQRVLILRGNDRIAADALDYSGELEQVVFEGRVKVELIPQKTP